MQDVSQRAKKNIIIMIIASCIFAGFLLINILRYVELGIQEPVVIFLDVMFLFVIFNRCQPIYYISLDKRSFNADRKSIFGKKHYEVPYREIIGVYKYKAALVHATKFRRSYTVNSALDKRPVWALAYRLMNKKGKMENRRIFFKASEEFLNAFEQKLPNKIRITEEDMAIEIFRREEMGK